MAVYFARIGNKIKIGVSGNVPARMRQIAAIENHMPELIGAVRGQQSLERFLHKRLQEYRLDGEWFQDCAAVLNEIDRCLSQYAREPSDTLPGFCLFGEVARIVWEKPDVALANIAGCSVRAARYWLSGKTDVPAVVAAALLTEIIKRR